MLTVLPVKDSQEIKNEYISRGLEFSENSACVKLKDADQTLGLCLFELYKDKVTVLTIEPKEDISLADGILRSALHVAAERFIFVADYSDDSLTELFEKLCFIKDKTAKTLDMDKLFGGCNCNH